MAEEYLPIVHLVFSNLKTWLNGTHHGVSHQHLQAYLNEFTFRFNRRFYPFNAFRSLLGIAGDTSAPTYDELYSGEWAHPKQRVAVGSTYGRISPGSWRRPHDGFDGRVHRVRRRFDGQGNWL